MKRIITEKMLKGYAGHLKNEEKSKATIDKYLCDLKKLMRYAAGKEIDKGLLIAYKKKLLEEEHYKISSINSFLVAANRFCEYMGWYEVRVKTYKVQKEAFCPDNQCISREEYFRLIKTAKKKGKARLSMILQAICATGMRVSELQYLTVDAVKNHLVIIHNKGKIRTILLPDDLRKELLYYIGKEEIKSGVVFCTASGKAVNRSNIWREMKALCGEAGVDAAKVFPHNLRHLFAQCFYAMKRDIAKLADILGHNNIETTRIYIRTSSEEHRRQLNEMKLVCVSAFG